MRLTTINQMTAERSVPDTISMIRTNVDKTVEIGMEKKRPALKSAS
jgi:hypothetical protein